VLGRVLQGVAGCCSALQCVAVCHSELQCVVVCCSVLQCVAVCVAACCRVLQCVWHCVLQCTAVCCGVLQCVAVCCSMLQCVAVYLVAMSSTSSAPRARAQMNSSAASGICRVSENRMSCTTWYIMYILTPYTSASPNTQSSPHRSVCRVSEIVCIVLYGVE